jgi:hypothetical protein
MGKIPEFSRTVLPQTAQYGLVDAARTEGATTALQHRVNADNIQDARHKSLQIQGQLNAVKLREAEAANTTWVNEQVVQFKRDTVDTLDQARQGRSENPVGFHKDFDKELEKRQVEMLKTAPSEAARIAIKQTLGGVRAGYYDENQNWERGRQTERFAESLDRTSDNLGVLAYRAGQDGIDLDKSGVLNDVSASVVAGSTFVAPDKLGAIKDTMSKTVVSNYMEGLFEKNPAKAKEVLNSRKYDKILGAEELQKFDTKIKAQERIEVTDDLEDVNQAAKLGIEVPKEKLTALIGKLEATGMREQAQNVRDYSEVQDAVVTFAKQPLTAQRDELKAMRTSIEGGDMADVKKYATLSDVLTTKQEAIEKDPWSYYAARDVVSDPGTMNLGDPVAMSAEMDRRRVAVQQVKDLDGVNMPLFTGAEIAGLKQTFETSQPREAAALLGSLNGALKGDEIGALAKAMSTQSSTLAVAIANGDPAVGEKILLGTQAKGEVKAADIRTAVNEKIGGAIIDPGKLEPIHDALYAYYKQLSVQAGDMKDAVDDDRLDQAVTDVMGPVVTIDTKFGYGGQSKVLSYKDDAGAWIDEDRLNDILRGITDEALEATGGMPEGPTGGKWTADKIRSAARFVSSGDGKYVALVDGLGYVSDKAGEPYIFDARRLAKYPSARNMVILPGGEVIEGGRK